MQQDDLKSLLGTFASIYESVSLFRVGDTSIVLVGSDSALDLHVLNIDAYVASHQGIVDDLNRIGLQRAEDVLGLFQFDRGVLIELVENAGHNTDDNMRIEYRAPLFLQTNTAFSNSLMLEEVAQVALESVSSERLARLAFIYAEQDLGWERALATLRFAQQRQPDDVRLESMYQEYLAMAIEAGHDSPAAAGRPRGG